MCIFLVAATETTAIYTLSLHDALPISDISAGGDHSMALDAGGTLQTWGSNDYGQLGRAPTTDNPSTQPGPVPDLTDISVIHAGNQYSAATSGTGSWAWGRNNQGQLGTNTTTDSATPTRIVAPDGAPAGFKYIGFAANRSEERRVGKETKTRWWLDHAQ